MAPANLPRDPVLKIEQQDFEEANEGLAAMCNGEALSADSPPPRALVAPATPPHARIKKEKFDQSYARFMLASSAWSRSLGSNAVIDLATPSPSRHGSTQGDDPLHLEATPPSETSHREPLPERAATSPRSPPASAPLPAPPTDMADAPTTSTSLPPNPDFDVHGEPMDVDELSEEDVFGFGGSLGEAGEP